MIEFALAFLNNFKFPAVLSCAILLFAVFFHAGPVENFNDEKLNKRLKRLTFILLPLITFIIAIPSIEDLWKVRIGLIKFNLASPANVEKGADEIMRIGKKLECKYLGCDERESK